VYAAVYKFNLIDNDMVTHYMTYFDPIRTTQLQF